MDTKVLNQLYLEVEKLHRNRDQVPKKEQEGKYKKAFLAKEETIRSLAHQAFWLGVCSGLDILTTDTEARQAGHDSVKQLQEEMTSSVEQITEKHLIQSNDIESFVCEMLLARCELERRFYADYWVSKCEARNGGYYNPILDMEYQPESEIWSDGNGRFTVAHPPTKAEYLKELKIQRDGLAKELADLEKKVA